MHFKLKMKIENGVMFELYFAGGIKNGLINLI